MKRDGGEPCTVAGENKIIVAAGRGDKQNQRAHDLRAEGHRVGGRRSGSRDGGDRISGLGRFRATAAVPGRATTRRPMAIRRRRSRASDGEWHRLPHPRVGAKQRGRPRGSASNRHWRCAVPFPSLSGRFWWTIRPKLRGWDGTLHRVMTT